MGHIEIRRQFVATLCANVLGLSFGLTMVWASANFLVLLTNETRLPSGPITIDEASMVASIFAVGGLLGNMSFLWIVERFGRKYPLLLLTIPQIISLLLIVYAKNVLYLYVSRILCGYVAGACIVCIPIFTIEICYDEIRGTLSAIFVLATNVGALLGFVIANYFDFVQQAIISMFFPILFFIVFVFVPETPNYLQRHNKTEAANSLLFYKGSKYLDEMAKLTSSEKTVDNETKLRLCDFSGRAARRAVIISVVLIVLNQLCGCYVIVGYSTKVFEKAGSNLTPIEASIWICIVQLVASVITIYLVDRAGRKILFVSSSIGAGIGLVGLGIHAIYKDSLQEYRWIPVVTVAFILFIASLGLLALPFTICMDILPPKIRNMTLAFCASLTWFIAFGMSAAYPPLNDYYGTHVCFFIFAAFCMLNAMFALFCIPETRSKSIQRIQEMLEK